MARTIDAGGGVRPEHATRRAPIGELSWWRGRVVGRVSGADVGNVTNTANCGVVALSHNKNVRFLLIVPARAYV
ncbi:hypothetical protein CCHOA_02970 [Corynebacterium choanae]|uniref:Uncharacterized protein n=1 Tax=Corynebacterium choanae TaxID=1862358 RepID=A0A3G6J986_9CORY|nr:hypothetical protein CCHOA_02970 [Corynebacterium choanae]